MKHPQFLENPKLALSNVVFSLCLAVPSFLHIKALSSFQCHIILSFFALLITFTETTFLKTDADFLEALSNPYRQDGSTALAAVLIGDQLYVANVGDSRAIALKGGEGNIFLIVLFC
jgi:serine/threonine protein phosphatase PrpC